MNKETAPLEQSKMEHMTWDVKKIFHYNSQYQMIYFYN